MQIVYVMFDKLVGFVVYTFKQADSRLLILSSLFSQKKLMFLSSVKHMTQDTNEILNLFVMAFLDS